MFQLLQSSDNNVGIEVIKYSENMVAVVLKLEININS